jgi:glycosyltransferase involved in cell wall biosynthesis
MADQRPTVALLLEGTYPYVSGGVSSWVHDIIRGLPDLSFTLHHIAAREDIPLVARYTLPPNVASLSTVYCAGAPSGDLDARGREKLETEIRQARKNADKTASKSRLLTALRGLHLDAPIDRALLEDLACTDLDVPTLLYGRQAFELVCELADKIAPKAPFLDFFWHFRSMHLPVLRLLHAEGPKGDMFHAVSTGYAGLVGAVHSVRSGRPLLLTEHGIYSRERDMELGRVAWLRASPGADAEGLDQLRLFWSHFFVRLSQVCYAQSARIVTLSEVNRNKQVADGAQASKIEVVPNGVDLDAVPLAPTRGDHSRSRPLRVGFVGRVVPIKDVVTLIKACHLARQSIELEVDLIGPESEDPEYANRCKQLVEQLRLQETVRFVGPRPLKEIYTGLDVVLLTSQSEGQPLVILEAYAAGLPVIATDVGACREMIEGRTDADKKLGPSGIVTHIATPMETAAALVKLAREPRLREEMGVAGRARVGTFYRRDRLLEAYGEMYRSLAARP